MRANVGGRHAGEVGAALAAIFGPEGPPTMRATPISPNTPETPLPGVSAGTYPPVWSIKRAKHGFRRNIGVWPYSLTDSFCDMA